MSSSAWVLMDDDCDCGGPPPQFHLPPPPVPPDLPCELLDTSCPAQLNILKTFVCGVVNNEERMKEAVIGDEIVQKLFMTRQAASAIGDAEFKRIGSFPSLAVIISCTLLSAVILLVIGAVLWRKRRKSLPQTKDFDHHHHNLGPSLPNGPNGLLYEDLSHARPRPPIATPSIEMLDVNHHHGLGNNGSKLDFSYFLNPPPIYEELPDLDGGQSDRNNGPSEDEFAEDELSVIDVPVVNQCHPGTMDLVSDLSTASRYGQPGNRNPKSRVQSLNRKRGRNSQGQGSGPASAGGFKSQRSLDRHNRNNSNGKYPGTNPRGYGGLGSGRPGMPPVNSGMLILSDHTGMTMKIPPHLVAVLTESALCNGGNTRPYEVIPAGGLVHPGSNLIMGQQNGVYPSSRSSGSSYGEASSSSSTRVNPNGTSGESSSFDSGIGQHCLASCINSPAYDQTGGMLQYSINPYEYSSTPNGTPTQFLTQQHPTFRRMRMTVSDRDHPLYSNHLLN